MSQRILIHLRGLLLSPSIESGTSNHPRKSDASEKWGVPEPSSYVHRTTRATSLSAKGTLCARHATNTRWPNKDTDSSARDHYDDVKQQEGTELVGVRVDRSVVVGVGPWNSQPSDEPDEPCRKPEVKWDQGL